MLNLQTFAPGGLRAVKEGGGMQTKNLRLETSNGDEYVFRLVDKSASGLPSELHGTPVQQILQDIVSSLNPAAAPVAASIVEAAGVLHATATLMVMPNDPALGEFRHDFAGRLGEIEPFPTVPKDAKEGWAGASKIIDSPELLKLLNTEAEEHVDARKFLMARLTDFLINDNDRHAGQWKWARFPSGPKTEWEPIARDRDHAFMSYEGVVGGAGRMVNASVVSFTGKPSVSGTHVAQRPRPPVALGIGEAGLGLHRARPPATRDRLGDPCRGHDLAGRVPLDRPAHGSGAQAAARGDSRRRPTSTTASSRRACR